MSKETKEKKTPEMAGRALQEVGKAACKRHGLATVWVTADGQCFSQENDARHHSKSLGQMAEPIKVEA